MKFMWEKKILLWAVWASVLLFPACATTVPPEALKDVDKEISFERLLKNPEAFKGKIVVLGGSIISIENMPDKTMLMVLQHDLNSDQEPLQNDQSKGRFMVYVPGFLDPVIYGKGRRITVVGTVVGEETRPLNEVSYVYPVVKRNTLTLWPVQDIYDSRPRIYFGIGFGGIGF